MFILQSQHNLVQYSQTARDYIPTRCCVNRLKFATKLAKFSNDIPGSDKLMWRMTYAWFGSTHQLMPCWTSVVANCTSCLVRWSSGWIDWTFRHNTAVWLAVEWRRRFSWFTHSILRVCSIKFTWSFFQRQSKCSWSPRWEKRMIWAISDRFEALGGTILSRIRGSSIYSVGAWQPGIRLSWLAAFS